MYTIRLVDASKERAQWAAVAAAQRACDSRLSGMRAAAELDQFSGRVFALVALDSQGFPMAGARIHVRDGEHPLPLERSFAGLSQMRSELERRAEQGVAEVGGLWRAEELAATAVQTCLVAAAVAYAPVMGVRHLVSFAGDHHGFADIGVFSLDQRLPVQWCDTATLEGARADSRRAILVYRRTIARGERARVDLGRREAAAVAVSPTSRAAAAAAL